MPERDLEQNAENDVATDVAPAAAIEAVGEALPFGESLQKAMVRAQDITRNAGLEEVTTDTLLLALLSQPKSTARLIAKEAGLQVERIATRVARRHGTTSDILLPADMRPRRGR